MSEVYPDGEIPAFLTWDLPTDGMTMWDWHAGRCAACGLGPRNGITLCLDHCHVTGRVRGFLCRTCNFDEGKRIHPVWLWWHAGRHPARLLDAEDEFINNAGLPDRRARDDREYLAAWYVVQIERYGETVGRQLARPFTWMPRTNTEAEDNAIVAALNALA